MLSYLPDNMPLTNISRQFLLSVLFYGNRDKYLELYEEYKNIQVQKSTSSNRKFTAIITDEMRELLKNYDPVCLWVNKILFNNRNFVICRNVIPNNRFIKQNNPINGLRIVDSNQQVQDMSKENQIGGQNAIPQQNNNVIRIITTSNSGIRRDGIRSNNSNDNEINIDAD